MAERTPAPGRVEVRTRYSLAMCQECLWRALRPGPSNLGGVLHLPPARASYDAGNDLREHLRTEHAALWRECGYCLGTGHEIDRWQTTSHTCTRCSGRGYIETERSAT